MIKTLLPDGLSDISTQYDALFCDVWGVIHNGRQAFELACDALSRFRQKGGAVILITNAPVPKKHVIDYCRPLGVTEEVFDDCVSSGDATRRVLERRQGDTFWHLGIDEGWDRDRFLWQGLDLKFVPELEANSILCMGLEDQVNDDPEDYRERLRAAVDRGCDMICANPDIKVRVGQRLVWCGGALAQIFEEEGGTVVYPGKPYQAIYDLAYEKLTLLGRDVPDARILCIGDSPATDMRGAANMGLDGLYVGTGLTEHGARFEADLEHLFQTHGTTARWAMPELRW